MSPRNKAYYERHPEARRAERQRRAAREKAERHARGLQKTGRKPVLCPHGVLGRSTCAACRREDARKRYVPRERKRVPCPHGALKRSCPPCRLEYQRAWWKRQDPERRREYQRQYDRQRYERDPEERLAKARRWREQNRERSRVLSHEAHRRRRARKRVVTIDRSITLQAVYHRDKGVCQLCGRRTYFLGLTHRKLSATIDHIVPISSGGGHVWENVQLAHASCNSKKGTRAA